MQTLSQPASRSLCATVIQISLGFLPCTVAAQTTIYYYPSATGVHACAGAGSVDGDGVPDFVVSTDVNGRGRATVYSGRWGTQMHSWPGQSPTDNYGFSVASAGDVDRDGRSDVMIAAPFETTGSAPGYVELRSGRTGLPLAPALFGGAAGDTFGRFVCSIGDVTGDGVPEILAGAPQQWNGGAGYVQIFDGGTRAPLRRLNGSVPGDGFGTAAAVARDASGIGWLAIGARGGLGRRGYVDVYSLPSITNRYRLSGDSVNDEFGGSICSIPDVTGDQRPDLVVGAAVGAARPGYFQVFDANTGQPTGIRRSDGLAGDQFGKRVTFLGDVGRGSGELAVSVPRGGLNRTGSVILYSTRTWEQTQRIQASAVVDYFGYALAAPGDVNGDGIPDLLVGGAAQTVGYAGLYSVVRMPLQADKHELSAATGGVVGFQVRAGSGNAGAFFWLLGSASGTSPCTPLPGGGCVPLVVDAYTNLSLVAARQLFVGAPGVLDASGAATPSFVPPRLPGLVGLRLHHACVVAHPTLPGFLATNAVPVTFVR
jgi:hypothetical protein